MATNENSIRFRIIPGKGPSKMDVLTALANAFESSTRVPAEPTRVKFQCKREPVHQQGVTFTLYARILGIQHEDGGGESFLINGYMSTAKEWSVGQSNAEKRFSGYYSTKTREGFLDIARSTGSAT